MTTSGGAPGSVAPAQTWPWIGTDSRGCVVILSQSRWLHAAPHHGDFGNPTLGLLPDPFAVICRAMTLPDLVLDNSQRRGAPSRSGHERYYRQDPYCDPAHVIVVVRILSTDELIDGYSAKSGSRVALTFYVSPSAPVGAQVWP